MSVQALEQKVLNVYPGGLAPFTTENILPTVGIPALLLVDTSGSLQQTGNGLSFPQLSRQVMTLTTFSCPPVKTLRLLSAGGRCLISLPAWQPSPWMTRRHHHVDTQQKFAGEASVALQGTRS